MRLTFDGPFSWPGTPDAPSIFESEAGRGHGIYLWTIARPDGHLVYYVGETGRSFAKRMAEHYKEHAAGFYHLHSPEEFGAGRKAPIWPGKYDPKNRRSVVECVRAFLDLAPQIAALTELLRFVVTDLDTTRRLRQRTEAALAQHLYAVPGMVGAFQEEDIRYAPRRGDELPVSCRVRSSVTLLGVPDQLWV